MSEHASYFFSSLCVAILLTIMIGNVIIVRQTSNINQICDKQKFIQSLYVLLDNNKKEALNFRSVFILRRLLTATVYVFIKDCQGVQMQLQILITLSMLLYMKAVPSFESNLLNYIEYLNEAIILGSQYYLLIFATDLPDDEFRAKLGLGFCIIVILHFVSTFIAKLIASFLKLYPSIRAQFKKLSLLLLKKCIKKTQTRIGNIENNIKNKQEFEQQEGSKLKYLPNKIKKVQKQKSLNINKMNKVESGTDNFFNFQNNERRLTFHHEKQLHDNEKIEVVTKEEDLYVPHRFNDPEDISDGTTDKQFQYQGNTNKATPLHNDRPITPFNDPSTPSYNIRKRFMNNFGHIIQTNSELMFNKYRVGSL